MARAPHDGLVQWKLAGVRADQVAGIARTACEDPGDQGKRVQLLPVRPRGRSRTHALHLLRPAGGARYLPADHRSSTRSRAAARGLHGEPEARRSALHELAQHEGTCSTPATASSSAPRQALLPSSSSRPTSSRTSAATGSRPPTGAGSNDPGGVQCCFQSYGQDVAGAAIARSGADEEPVPRGRKQEGNASTARSAT